MTSPVSSRCIKTVALRRSPRIATNTRSTSGRLLNCSKEAAKDFKSPFQPNISPADDITTPLRELPTVVSRCIKRRSSQALTPLRKEMEEFDSPRPPKSLSPSYDSESEASGSSGTNSRSDCPAPTLTSLSTDDPVIAAPLVPKEFNFCSMPPEVRNKYCERRKIKQLYDWQKECLSDHRLLRGSNCIVTLPTGAGKTLIAEILMLREAIVNKRSSILVLPFVAIVQEKINSLSAFEEDFGIKIEEYAATKGRLPPIKRRKGVPSIYVATIEKANMLMNSLIETERLDSVGLLVVDELHMVGDGSRGAIIEQLLIKFQCKGSGQVVGMSATLSNMPEMAKFLRAHIYSTDFRPVQLHEFVRIGQVMWKVQQPGGRLVFEADLKPNRLSKVDPDGVCQLLEGVIPDKSVIIFCPTKKNCESVAALIARNVPTFVRQKRSDDRKRLVAAMKEDNDGKLDHHLEQCLLSGIAYHHSGLTHDERKHIEAAYAEGILCVICATSTLAAGVNLPARRVIIKSPTLGRDALGKAHYLQMAGRAGRAGFDAKGECITIVRPGMEERQFREMLHGPMLSCTSVLSDIQLLSAFILDLIALNLASTVDSVMEVLHYSLLISQKGFAAGREVVLEAVDKLKSEQLVLENSDDGKLSSTLLGSSTFDANLRPAEARRLEHDLTASLNQGLVFSSHFHLLFTIAPYDTACAINWDLFHSEYKNFSEGEKKLLAKAGLPDHVIIQSIISMKRLEAGQPAMRLFISIMLLKVWNQEPHSVVAERFGVERGWLQSVLQSAISQASAIARFSEKQPTLWPLRLLLPELVQRLSDCVRVELIPLMGIEGVKRGRARQLYAAGYKTVAAVAKADAQQLVSSVEHLKKFQASKIINSAKTLLRDQLDEKMEEIEAMGIDLHDVSF